MNDFMIDDSALDMPALSSVCGRCRHYDLFTDKPMTCPAFPDGIPKDIWMGKNDHTHPVDGDHGIRFESRENVDHQTPQSNA